MNTQSQPILLPSPNWDDYELLDSGDRKKLERFGPYCFVRPEARATWGPSLPQQEWEAAHGVFQSTGSEERGSWHFRTAIKPRWTMQYKELRFWAQPTPFRHMGVFPEQAIHWDWMSELIRAAGRPIKVLNLFAYTGLATLAAAIAGASVTHVDSSKKTVAWARENQELSGLGDRSIRWIIDDALKFAEREVRRRATYDGFIIDPPPFGRGPKGEIWRFEESLPALFRHCRALLSQEPLFFVLTAYAVKVPTSTLSGLLADVLADKGGEMTAGDMVIVERSAGHVLPAASFARWAPPRMS